MDERLVLLGKVTKYSPGIRNTATRNFRRCVKKILSRGPKARRHKI